MKSLLIFLGAALLSVPLYAQSTQAATWSVGAWHRNAMMSVRSYGYVGAVVQGKFFPAVPHGPKWLFIVRQEGGDDGR